MRLATLRGDSRDGALGVVDRAAQRFLSAAGIVRTLQAALDDWDRHAPALRALSNRLENDPALGVPLDVSALGPPLPRAYEWVDGSAYLNHVLLVRRAGWSSVDREPRRDLRVVIHEALARHVDHDLVDGAAREGERRRVLGRDR